MKKCAIIDLGTNTFHLLIVECQKDAFIEIYREKTFVSIASDGIETISDKAYKRAFVALEKYVSIIRDHHIETIKAFGTAGLRTASNGMQFIAEVKNKLGLEINLISGEREAELISKGVGLLIPQSNSRQLIMDIGGGSVEFIIKYNNKIEWAKSFPIGVAVLFRNFHHTEPITNENKKSLFEYLNLQLNALWKQVKDFDNIELIGASGTFDVLDVVLNSEKVKNYSQISTKQFNIFIESVLPMSIEERLKIEGMPKNRVELMVVALLLIDIILKKISINKILISHFALKEGIISELLENNRVI